MPVFVPKSNAIPPVVDGIRKRRVHGKSRKGCGNCKLRRVKVSLLCCALCLSGTDGLMVFGLVR
jgi:hypothetical protein